MATVMYEVTNLMNTEHEEKFKGKMLRIPANGSIKLPKADANQFMAQMATNEKGRLVPKRLKCKRIGQEAETGFICNFCGKDDFADKEEYLVHLNTHAGERYKNEDLDKKLEEEEGALSCPFCEFSTKRDDYMKIHLRTKHMPTRRRKIAKAGD